MDYRLLIARRYLVSRKRVTLISVVSGISVAGVALGVAALVIVLSVMNGFYDIVRDMLVSYDPHVRIESVDNRGLSNPDSLVEIARLLPEVESATPFVEGKALLTSTDGRDFNQVVVARGVDAEAVDSSVTRAVVGGTFDVSRTDVGPGIVMGRGLTAQSALFPGVSDDSGSQVALLSAPALEGMLVQYPFGLPARQLFVLRGTYELEPTYDKSHVFIALEEAQRLFRMSGSVSGIDIRLENVNDASRIKSSLQQTLGSDQFRIKTWYDLQPSLYSVMKMEKWAASAILLLIIVVAAFNIVGALTMIVVEKRRDLGALQAMGASRRHIRHVFLIEGLLVGLVGTGIGLLAGLGLSAVQKYTGMVKLTNAESFIIDAYPVGIRFMDISLIAVVAVSLCVLAALYPSRKAATVEPAQAVRGTV